MKGNIAILATMDTKGEEVAYMKEYIEDLGYSTLLIDVGPMGPPSIKPDITNMQVAKSAGWELRDLLQANERDRILEVMGVGASKLLSNMMKENALLGIIGLGGNQGTAVGSTAMRVLPIGFPKLLVSTVASGNIRPYIGCKDIAVMFSVGDLVGGPNKITRSILSNAVSALLGMIEHGERISLDKSVPTIAISALGNTEQATSRAMQLLRERGFQVIAFHASGAGGSAMEELIETDFISAVLDLTPHELTEEVVGAGAYIPVRPGRLIAAGQKGIPQVIATGSMEYLCFGPRESIPLRFRRRKTYMHNPCNANVKVSCSEMAKIGRVMAQRLNKAKGHVAVLVPLRGWSMYGGEGGPLYDPKGYRLLVETLQKHLKRNILCEVCDNHINDPLFVDRCVHILLKFMERGETQ